jgi:hypothetical protein
MIDENQQGQQIVTTSVSSAASAGSAATDASPLTIDIADVTQPDLQQTSPQATQHMIRVGKRVKITNKTLEQAGATASASIPVTPISRKSKKAKADTSPSDKQETKKPRKKRTPKKPVETPDGDEEITTPKKRGRKRKKPAEQQEGVSEDTLPSLPQEFEKTSLMHSKANIRKMLMEECSLREENSILFEEVRKMLNKFEKAYHEQRENNDRLLKRVRDLEIASKNLSNHKEELKDQLIAAGAFVPDSEDELEQISESDEDVLVPSTKKRKHSPSLRIEDLGSDIHR